jgi:biopolymer transport protein ExbB
MSTKFVKAVAIAVASTFAFSAAMASAQDDKPRSLDQLLEFVKQGQVTEARENRAREQAFANDKASQAAELQRVNAERTRQEALSAQLENQFEANELLVTAKQDQLKDKLGTLSELFGHLTSTAGDLAATMENSVTSAQFPDREQFLETLIAKMSSSDKLPSIEEIEQVWYEMNREMVEAGRVVAFTAQVSKPTGEKLEERVVRVGAFNVIAEDGRYLQYVAEKGSLEALARQPAGPYQGWAQDLAAATEGLHRFGIDPTGPSGGSFLAALINSPDLVERWHEGQAVGYAITVLGIFGLLLGLSRLVILYSVNSKVNAQLKSDRANENNPLGRVIKIYENNPTMDTETLELKLSEGILKETPSLEYGLSLLKIIASLAPLMGLLGTVTGMIVTFQAITIFGAGDPKAMASGISQALVTTVEGLVVAIPIVLLFTIVNGRAQRILHILNEQTTGIIAEHNEARQGK